MWPRRLAEDLRLARDPHQRPHRAALDVPGGPPCRPRPGPRRRASRAGPGHEQVVEGGAPRRLPRLQPERQGPDGRIGVLDPAVARRPRVHAADLGRGPDRRGRGVHDRDRAGAVRRDRRPGRRHRRRRRARSRPSSSSAAATRPRAKATPRGRRTTPSRPASRRGSSRRRRGAPSPSTSRAAARAAGRRRRSPPNAPRRSRPAIRMPACRPSGRARAPRRPAGARPTIPVIEISRAASKAEALEGLERWKARHPRRPPPSSRPTSSSTGCAAGRRSGIASGSTSPTCRRRTARPRSRSIPTTTRGPATTSRPGRRGRTASEPRPVASRRPNRRTGRRPTAGDPPTGDMTRDEFQALLDRAAAGWAGGDAAAVGDCFAEDVEYLDPFLYRFDRASGPAPLLRAAARRSSRHVAHGHLGRRGPDRGRRVHVRGPPPIPRGGDRPARRGRPDRPLARVAAPRRRPGLGVAAPGPRPTMLAARLDRSRPARRCRPAARTPPARSTAACWACARSPSPPSWPAEAASGSPAGRSPSTSASRRDHPARAEGAPGVRRRRPRGGARAARGSRHRDRR